MKKQPEKNNFTLRMYFKNLLQKARRKLRNSLESQKIRRTNRKLLFAVEHYPTLLSRYIKGRYRLLTDLRSLDDNKKIQINRGMVKDYAFRLSILNLAEDRLHLIRDWLYSIVNIGFILSVGISYYNFMELSYRVGRWAGYSSIVDYSLKTLPIIMFLLLYEVLFSLIAGRISFNQRVFLIAGVITGGIYYLFNPIIGYRFYVFGIVGVEIIRALSIIVDTFIYMGFEWHMRKRLQYEIIVYNILLMLHEIDGGYFSTLYFKRYLALRLEYAASYIENYIYQGVKTNDDTTNAWIKEKTKQIASALRAKKKLIFLPKPDTSKKLMNSLVDFLIRFQNNEWGELETLDLPKKSWRENLVAHTPIIAKSLLFGLLPICSLLFLQYLHIVSKPFGDTIINIAIIWAIINILWLDPSAKEKINAVKDATAIFKG